jgi:hypothetical protein
MSMTWWMEHYEKVITEMQADICRLIEEKAALEDRVEELLALRDHANKESYSGSEKDTL